MQRFEGLKVLGSRFQAVQLARPAQPVPLFSSQNIFSGLFGHFGLVNFCCPIGLFSLFRFFCLSALCSLLKVSGLFSLFGFVSLVRLVCVFRRFGFFRLVGLFRLFCPFSLFLLTLFCFFCLLPPRL